MKRFTETSKWDDPWFRSLAGVHKLVFLYIIDRCDNAGFWEVDEEGAAFQTKLDIKHIRGAWVALERGLKGADGWVWVKNFLKHQKNEKLNPDNPAHRQIISLLKNQERRFSVVPEFVEFMGQASPINGASMGLQSPIGTGIGTGKGTPERKTKKKNKNAFVATDNAIALRVARIFNRRNPETWDPEQLKQVERQNLDEQDLLDLEEYYASERIKGEEGIHRRDMATFLNNLPGELDRAHAWRRQFLNFNGGGNGHKPKPQPPEGADEWIAENYPQFVGEPFESLAPGIQDLCRKELSK